MAFACDVLPACACSVHVGTLLSSIIPECKEVTKEDDIGRNQADEQSVECLDRLHCRGEQKK
jgi:hypothetical protein